MVSEHTEGGANNSVEVGKLDFALHEEDEGPVERDELVGQGGHSHVQVIASHANCNETFCAPTAEDNAQNSR